MTCVHCFNPAKLQCTACHNRWHVFCSKACQQATAPVYHIMCPKTIPEPQIQNYIDEIENGFRPINSESVWIAADSPIAYMITRHTIPSTRIGADIVLDRTMHRALAGHVLDVLAQTQIGMPLHNSLYETQKKDLEDLMQRIRVKLDNAHDLPTQQALQADLADVARALHTLTATHIQLGTLNTDVVSVAVRFLADPKRTEEISYQAIEKIVRSMLRVQPTKDMMQAVIRKAVTTPELMDAFVADADFTGDFDLITLLREGANKELLRQAAYKYLEYRREGTDDINKRFRVFLSFLGCSLVTASLFVELGADVNYVENEKYHETRIWYASRDGLEVLLRLGADPNIKNIYGTTFLMTCGDSGGTIDKLQMLIAAGAKLDERDDDGFTALMLRIMHGDTRAAILLIEAGADVNKRNRKGKGALDILATQGSLGGNRDRVAIAERLLLAGATADEHILDYIKDELRDSRWSSSTYRTGNS